MSSGHIATGVASKSESTLRSASSIATHARNEMLYRNCGEGARHAAVARPASQCPSLLLLDSFLVMQPVLTVKMRGTH